MYCDFPVLGRCCFCLPLRRGLIGLGYLSLLFNTLMVVIYSSVIYTDNHDITMVKYLTEDIRPLELIITLYCLEVVFCVVLIYGAHMKSTIYIKVYYYFAITTIVASLLVQILGLSLSIKPRIMQTLISTFCGFCTQLYLIILVRSLLRRLEHSGPQVYENQLQQIVSGEARVEPNGIYNNTTVIPED